MYWELSGGQNPFCWALMAAPLTNFWWRWCGCHCHIQNDPGWNTRCANWILDINRCCGLHVEPSPHRPLIHCPAAQCWWVVVFYWWETLKLFVSWSNVCRREWKLFVFFPARTLKPFQNHWVHATETFTWTVKLHFILAHTHTHTHSGMQAFLYQDLLMSFHVTC